MLRTRWLVMNTARRAGTLLTRHPARPISHNQAPILTNGEPKVSRFDRRLSVLRVDRKGDLAEEETTIKELLWTTDMHVSEDDMFQSSLKGFCLPKNTFSELKIICWY